MDFTQRKEILILLSAAVVGYWENPDLAIL